MKVLLVGLGGIGQRHARNLRHLLGKSATLLAYRSRGLTHVITPELQSDESRDVEGELGIQSFTTLATALAERPRVAIICSPSSLHVEAAIACIRAGCDLFVEKPVSSSLQNVS